MKKWKNKITHYIHHLLFPRESNNHRSKVLHHDSLFFIVALFVFLGSTVGVVQNNYPQVLGISSNITAQDLLAFTNQKRQENGLGPLTLNAKLSQAAEQKASHMFANDYWAHVAPDGTTPWYFIKSAGYEYLYAGENLARGFTTASAVVDAWMASPTHRENMLSANYDDVGFAIQTGTLTGSETILVVQELGRQYGSSGQVATAETVQAPEPTPTPIVVAVATVAPTQAILPTATPTLIPSPTPLRQDFAGQAQEKSSDGVAASLNQPLFDSKSLTKNISLGILIFLVLVLIIDAVIIERRSIVRMVAHNADHILFIIIVILVIIVISRGWIL